jgi:PAS domain S-box-containing protein
MISAVADLTHHVRSILLSAPAGLNPSGVLHPSADGRFMLWILDLLVIAIGFVCSCAAFYGHLRARTLKISALTERRASEAKIQFRDALIASGAETVLLLGENASETFTPHGANTLLQAGMEGPDAKRLALFLDDLLKTAAPFEFVARARQRGAVVVRGAMVERRPVLFLKDLRVYAQRIDYHAALDALSVPVWIRAPDLTLSWANQAFVDATDAKSLENALATQATLETAEYSASPAPSGMAVDMQHTAGAASRKLSLSFARLRDANVVGMATDVTALVQAEATLRLNDEAANDMLEGMPVAISVFGKDQRLSKYNGAYAQMWGLSEDWLGSRPSFSQILDRLRENNRLPEQADFLAWKRQQLQLFSSCDDQNEEFWHLSGGKSLRVAVKPHLLGGIYILFTDVSAQLRLESAFTLLSQVQRATLDTVDDGIAIFGPDGRLVLHNQAFARQWHLKEEELNSQPHFTLVAKLAESRVGQDGIWSIVSTGLTSGEPERCAQWGKALRADGRVISLSMVRLPNGATIVTFADLTDLENFENLQRSSHAVA